MEDEEIDLDGWENWTTEEHEEAMDEYDDIWNILANDLSKEHVKLLSKLIELERIFVRLENV